jgi:hypothetical protein
MLPIFIGITSGLATILLVRVLRLLNTQTVYGLILSGIGFLYVGFSWSNTGALIFTSAQALIFLLLAYHGSSKSINLLAFGYFLHGIWDLAYNLHPAAGLIPPHYDLFCVSIDFTIGCYLLRINYLNTSRNV